jgi:hypothetical protein
MELDKLISHHQKCVNVLEMIETCRRRKVRYQRDIHTSFIGEWYQKQIPIMDAVEQRLTNYYKNLISNQK